MTEQELVQEALGNLPRPAPPPRLRRAVMAQVRAEAQAAAPPLRTWSRTEEGGWTTERWEGAGWSGEMVPAPTPARVIYTHRRQDEPGRTTIYQFTQTD